MGRNATVIDYEKTTLVRSDPGSFKLPRGVVTIENTKEIEDEFKFD